MRRTLIVFLLLALLGCQREAATPLPTTANGKRTLTTPPAPNHRFDATINAADFAFHVQTLAADEFEGRAPGTLGERLTAAYLQQQFQRIGLQPANNGSYFQSVPMVSATVDPATTLTVSVKGAQQILKLGDDMVVGSRLAKPEVRIDASDLVFVGYGVVAPQWQWDDYAGIDVKGKTVVVLINDPGFVRKDPDLFKGTAMTYFGRWTYKYEEAARHGAAGCLIVHDDAGAAYDWRVVRAGWVGPRHFLPADADPEARLPIEGWISAEAAARLFAAAGQDLEALRLQADQRGFKALALPARLDTVVRSTLKFSRSDNAVALLPGTTRKDEAIVYSAHWDHLGKHEDESGDNIYNGARDNASGVAAVLEIAEAFAHQDPPPARSVLFLIPTLEESSLLGSRYYVEHPLVALDKTVAEVNMDDLPIRGHTKDMAIIGFGESTLDEMLSDAAQAQGRVALEDPNALLTGFFYRSDHFNFVRRGVPVLYARGGFDLPVGGVEAGRSDERDYSTHRYHKPADEFDPGWDFSGVIEDVQALYAVGRRIAAGEATPAWKPGAEFKP